MNILDLFQNKAGVLGMNNRNVSYTRPYNSRRARRIADSKLRTKNILRKAGLPVPKTYAIIRTKDDLENFDWNTLPKSFVLKPNRGTHGQGIVVAYGRSKKTGNWIGNEGKTITIDYLKSQIQSIIDGKFSMGSYEDIAFFEERVRPHPELKPYFYKGLPDIRVVVFNKVPLMAAARLPTKRSEGKANVHAGAMYIGLDMASGVSTHAVVRIPYALVSDSYTEIEHTVDAPYTPLRGIQIPYWDKVLEIAVKAQLITKLGYAGVDITIDRDLGPLILELNARPGLAIQHANLDGLEGRLKRVSGLKIRSAARGVAVGKSLFGGEVEEEVENITGKQVIGIIEEAKLYSLPFEKKTRKKKRVKTVKKIIITNAKIDTGAYRTSIDEELMRRLGYGEAIDYFNSFKYPTFKKYDDAKKALKERAQQIRSGEIEKHPMIVERVLVKSASGITIRPIVKVELSISGVKFETHATVLDRSNLDYKIIIGRRDMKQFIVDPSKKAGEVR